MAAVGGGACQGAQRNIKPLLNRKIKKESAPLRALYKAILFQVLFRDNDLPVFDSCCCFLVGRFAKDAKRHAYRRSENAPRLLESVGTS